MKKSINLILILYTFLILGFFFNIDPNGGAFLDYQNHLRVINDFKENFSYTFFKYDDYATRHSPILYILISLFYKLNIPDQIIRIVFLHICLFLPIIFYKCLILKYPNIENKKIILFSSLTLLSPTFLSLSIWPDSRLFGLIFFCLSIYYFLNFKNKKNFSNCISCILSYTAASYLSPNFAVFSIFYFYFFYKEYKFSKKLFYIISINILLAIPAFLYLFALENIFLLNTATPGGYEEVDQYNFSNKILIISTIVFFYILPFIFVKSFKINFFNFKILIISILISVILIFNFNYNFNLTGGGIFFQISNFFFNNNYFFFLICIFSFFTIINIFKIDKINILIIFLLLLSNPQYTIYHKYYDPLMLILFSLIFELKINENNLFNYRSILLFYLYNVSFLIMNFIK